MDLRTHREHLNLSDNTSDPSQMWLPQISSQELYVGLLIFFTKRESQFMLSSTRIRELGLSMSFVHTLFSGDWTVRVAAQSQEDSLLCWMLCNMHVFTAYLRRRSHCNSVLSLESSPNPLASNLFIAVSFVTRDMPRTQGGQRWRTTSGKVRQSLQEGPVESCRKAQRKAMDFVNR